LDRAKAMILSMGLFFIGILGFSCLFTTSIFNQQQQQQQQNQALAQQYIPTIKYRNLVIDLGNGLKTNAQLTYPAIDGNGKYPGVLLVHGSGALDMNETSKNAKPFWQIAQYLSERGFAVLRYDKRGIGVNSTIMNSNVWGNRTFNDLKHDAQKALSILAQQPEVDSNRITIIGHSEGTMIAPRVAIDNNNSNNNGTTPKIQNIVLMGTVAQNLRDLLYLQVVGIPLLYSQKVLDHNHNGLLSVSEASENPVFSTMSGAFVLGLENAANNRTKQQQQQQLNPNYNTNKDTYISINNELKPKLVALFKSLSVVKSGEKCDSIGACPIWLNSHYALEPTLSIIGNIPRATSILILQGENDTQTPVQQALLLQQKLTDKRHPDHSLVTYPNLGHNFYPSSEWQTALGPIEPYVLSDLYSWLEAHSGFTNIAANMPSSTSMNSTIFK
jgi:alpha-beta hydrolase superfamily lysophospholipase